MDEERHDMRKRRCHGILETTPHLVWVRSEDIVDTMLHQRRAGSIWKPLAFQSKI